MLPYLFIFVYNLIKSGMVLVLPSVLKEEAVYFFFITFVLQMVFSPLQGGVSDHYCRKKSLLISFTAIALGQLLIFYSFKLGSQFLLYGIIVNGVLGNGEVLARAALIDVYLSHNRRKIIGWSFIIKMVPYIITGALLLGGYYSEKIFLYYFLVAIATTLLIAFLFKDRRDLRHARKVHHVILEDLKTGFGFLAKKSFFVGFLGLLFFELAYDFSFYYQDAAVGQRFVEAQMVIFFSIGFIVGALSLFQLRISNQRAIIVGLFLGIIGHSIATLIALAQTTWLQQSLGFFIFQFGAGICFTGIFSFFSQCELPHQQGKLFGLMDSIQTIGEMIAAGLLLYAISLTLKLIGLITICFFAISLFLFIKHMRAVKKKME